MAVAFSGQSSLAADIAQRAIVQSFKSPGDRVGAFTKALFAEAGNYLVSRDLPGFVGPAGRARNVSEALQFKNEIRSQIARRVAEVPRPAQFAEAGWKDYVGRVVSQLKRVN
jgi:hypothetical protein